MQTSSEGINLIKSFEGLGLKAYPDPATGGKPYTIGHGTTIYPSGMPVKLGDTCTAQQAMDYLRNDLKKFEKMVDSAVTVPLSQGHYDAMVSIVYNVGPGSKTKSGIIRLKDGSPSTLLRKLNSSDYLGAADEFLKWVSPGSNVEAGLRRRRQAERQLFLS